MSMCMARSSRRWTRVLAALAVASLLTGPVAEARMRQTETQIQVKSEGYNTQNFPWQQVMAANQQGVEFRAPGPPPPVTRDKTTATLVLTPQYGDAEDAEARRYEATFEASYVIRNKKESEKKDPEEKAKEEKTTFVIFFPFPAGADTIRDAQVMVRNVDAPGEAAKDVPDAVYRQEGVSFETTFLPKQTKEIVVSYRAFGSEDFVFALDHGERMKQLDFSLSVLGAEHAPDLEASNSLEPTTPLARSEDGYTAEWSYQNLLTTLDVVVSVPEPFVGANVAQRLPALVRAGVASVLLLWLLLALAAVTRRRSLGSGQYLLIGVALVLFYPLVLHLSKYLPPTWAFIIAFVVVGALVLVTLRRALGLGFALVYGGFGLVTTLGMLSAAALLTSGSGLLVTIALVLLLGFTMSMAPRLSAVLTERSEEARRLRAARGPMAGTAPGEPPTPGPDEDAPPAAANVVAEREPPAATQAEPGGRFCAYCGCEVARHFRYCPQCSREVLVTVECPSCGTEICRVCGTQYSHCPSCGAKVPQIAPEAGEQ